MNTSHLYYKQKYNFHKGINDWGEITSEQDKFDIAAAVQMVYQQRLNEFMHMAYSITGKTNLVFMGGCALNSSANTLLWNIFKDIWIMPNPGDAGSSLGAAAALYGKHIEWKDPYLGYDLGGDISYPENCGRYIKRWNHSSSHQVEQNMVQEHWVIGQFLQIRGIPLLKIRSIKLSKESCSGLLLPLFWLIMHTDGLIWTSKVPICNIL